MAEGERDSLVDCMLSGLDLSRRLAVLNNSFPREVWDFIKLVEGALECGGPKPFPIYFHTRDYQSNTFHGAIEAFADHAHIYYSKTAPRCWRRFVVVKELCHLLFASHGHHLVSTAEGVEELIDKIMVGLALIDIRKDPSGSTETATIYMALEVLLPHSERLVVQNMLVKGASHLDIAKKYLIPEAFVKLYLSNTYVEMMDHIYLLGNHSPVDKVNL